MLSNDFKNFGTMKEAVASDPSCRNSFLLISGPLPPPPKGREIKAAFFIFFSDFIPNIFKTYSKPLLQRGWGGFNIAGIPAYS
jgi:hypothetical protein